MSTNLGEELLVEDVEQGGLHRHAGVVGLGHLAGTSALKETKYFLKISCKIFSMSVNDFLMSFFAGEIFS